MKKLRVLITGAAGFIGFHVAHALREKGHEVIGYDNFNDYYDPLLKHARAQHLAQKDIVVHEHDINDVNSLRSCVNDFAPTHILHLAAQAGVRYSLTHPQKYVQANLEGFVNILEICREHPSIPLVYASSSSVYGTNEKIPFAVRDPTDRPTSLYAATKKANEVMAHAYHHCFGLHVTGLRFFTVYGPWGRPDMAYFSFTRAILEGKPIQLFNQGNMQRDFTYIDDTVEGIIRALELGAPFEIFNLGNHQPISLLRFVELIEQATGKKAIKEFVPMATGDVPATYADIAHSTEMLGFVPKTPLTEGIIKFVDWYRHYADTAAKTASVLL